MQLTARLAASSNEYYYNSKLNFIILDCKYLVNTWELGLAESFWGINKSKIVCSVFCMKQSHNGPEADKILKSALLEKT